MKNNIFTETVDEVIKLKMDIADEYIADVIDAIGDVGNPEKLIGKESKYWTLADRQLLGNIYGDANDTPLAKVLFRDAYQEVLNLEQEVK